MRISIIIAAITLAFAGCSPQEKEQARQDARKAEQKIRDGAKVAGREIKKDLHAADEQLKDSMEKGKAAAQRAAKELRKEINESDTDKKR